MTTTEDFLQVEHLTVTKLNYLEIISTLPKSCALNEFQGLLPLSHTKRKKKNSFLVFKLSNQNKTKQKLQENTQHKQVSIAQ